jgi:hypothetical protein
MSDSADAADEERSFAALRRFKERGILQRTS